MSVSEMLRDIPLFAGLSEDECQKLILTANRRTVSTGEMIFRQGDAGATMYIPLAGEIQLFKMQNGLEFDLGVAKRGEYFGEMALIDGTPRSAFARALSDGELLELGREQCLSLMQRHPRFQREALQRLARHLRESNTHRFGLIQEQERLRTESELERLRSLSQMVAGVAHEINTPLGIIQNAASFVTEQLTDKTIAKLTADEEGQETLQDIAAACQLIQRNIAVASRLVTSFKSLSVRQIADLRESVDLIQVVEQVVDLYKLKARSSNLSIEINQGIPIEERIWDGFPGNLSQVLLNLLTNCDRYAYPNGTGGTVRISLRCEEYSPGHPGFAIDFQDFGSGIPADHIDKIFEPFFTTGRDREGTGLGLAIVYNIMTSSLGGTIKVRSKLGQGSTFQLRFPKTAPERKPQ